MGSLGLWMWSALSRSIFDRVTGHFWVAPVLVMEMCVHVILASFRVQSSGFQDLHYLGQYRTLQYVLQQLTVNASPKHETGHLSMIMAQSLPSQCFWSPLTELK